MAQREHATEQDRAIWVLLLWLAGNQFPRVTVKSLWGWYSQHPIINIFHNCNPHFAAYSMQLAPFTSHTDIPYFCYVHTLVKCIMSQQAGAYRRSRMQVIKSQIKYTAVRCGKAEPHNASFTPSSPPHSWLPKHWSKLKDDTSGKKTPSHLPHRKVAQNPPISRFSAPRTLAQGSNAFSLSFPAINDSPPL